MTIKFLENGKLFRARGTRAAIEAMLDRCDLSNGSLRLVKGRARMNRYMPIRQWSFCQSGQDWIVDVQPAGRI